MQAIIKATGRGFTLSLKEIVKNFYAILGNSYSFLPLFYGIYFMIIKFKQPGFTFYLSYTFSCFLMILFFSFLSSDPHYNLVLIPYFIPALVFFVNIIYKVFSEKYIKYASFALVFFFCIIFSEGIIKYFYDLTKIFHDDTGTNLVKAGKLIDENTKPGDKIISLGGNAYIYPFTERTAASRYFYQTGWLQIPNAREDFLSDVLTNKPAIIAIFSDIDGNYTTIDYWHEPVVEMLENDYALLSNEYDFHLFKRKN
jgi:hypothetical protein